MRELRPQHSRAIARLVERFQNDAGFPAIIVGGSIAKGWEKEDSDVDIMLLATDEEYARRAPRNDLGFYSPEMCDYAGGYIDGKIINWGYLEEVADHGNEPTRSAFKGAFTAYSRRPELEALMARIPVYPAEGHEQRIASFYAQVQAMKWYVGEAEKRADRYLMTRMATELVLFGGRLILAHNRMLYPYHKWLMKALSTAPLKPEGMVAVAEELLAQPTKDRGWRFADLVLNYHPWAQPPEGWPPRFVHDVEQVWRRGEAPLADR